MAFNSTQGRAEYTATSGQTIFPFTFKIYETSDIKVYQTAAGATPNDVSDLLIETTDYTVVITGDSGGTVTLLTGATVNDAITIKRDLPIIRNIEYQENGDLFASTINMDQDYQTYLIADKESDNSRFLRLQDSAQGLSTEIPSPVPLNFFQWNSTGTGIVNVATLQADGFIWTAAEVYTATQLNAGQLDDRYYTETEIDNAVLERRKLYAKETAIITPTADTDYTLAAAENLYGRLLLADGSWTADRNIIVDASVREFIADNTNGTYNATVKTSLGTGIIIPSGRLALLYADGTNVIDMNSTSITSNVLFSGGFDLGQAWVDETASRADSVTYTNNTGRPIVVSIYGTVSVAGGGVAATVNGDIVSVSYGRSTSVYLFPSLYFIVPALGEYIIAGTSTINKWEEYK